MNTIDRVEIVTSNGERVDVSNDWNYMLDRHKQYERLLKRIYLSCSGTAKRWAGEALGLYGPMKPKKIGEAAECQHCGDNFTVKSTNQRYCSQKCSRKSLRERSLGERIEATL